MHGTILRTILRHYFARFLKDDKDMPISCCGKVGYLFPERNCVMIGKSGYDLYLKKGTWCNYKMEHFRTGVRLAKKDMECYSGMWRFKKKTIGTFRQLPIKYAYALSIPECIGLELPPVKVELGDEPISGHMLFAAMSCVSSVLDFSTSRKLTLDDFKFDSGVINFYKDIAVDKSHYFNISSK